MRSYDVVAPNLARKNNPWVWLVLAIWAAATLVLCASLLVGHFATLPVPPKNDAVVSAGLATVSDPDTSPHWRASHFLYAKCNCSKRVVEHLLTSKRPSQLGETIFIIGENDAWEHRAKAAGFVVQKITQERLRKKFGLESAPLMVVSDPKGQVQYIGGYTDRKQGLAIRDREVIEALRQSQEVASIPLYGCAVSRTLQDALDPLGIKY